MSEEGDWNQYKILSETVWRGTELVLKANVLYYAVTGGILSFYFSRPVPVPHALRFSLVFPALMGIALAVIFARAASTMWRHDAEIAQLSARLQLSAYPDASALRAALIASSLLFVVTAAVLIILLLSADAVDGTPRASTFAPDASFWLQLIGLIAGAAGGVLLAVAYRASTSSVHRINDQPVVTQAMPAGAVLGGLGLLILGFLLQTAGLVGGAYR